MKLIQLPEDNRDQICLSIFIALIFIADPYGAIYAGVAALHYFFSENKPEPKDEESNE